MQPHTLQNKTEGTHGHAADTDQVDTATGLNIFFNCLISMIHHVLYLPNGRFFKLTNILYIIHINFTTVIIAKKKKEKP